MKWQLAEAKNKFSELVNKALVEGPQIVQRRHDVVVVLSQDEYNKLTKQNLDFKDFLLNSGPSLEGVPLEREQSSMRDIQL